MKIKIRIGYDTVVYNNLEEVYDAFDLEDRVHKVVLSEADLLDIIKEEYTSWSVKVTLIQQYQVEYVTSLGKHNVEYFDTKEEAYERFRALCSKADYLMTTLTAMADPYMDTVIVKKISIGKSDIQGNYTCMETGQMKMEYTVHNIIIE